MLAALKAFLVGLVTKEPALVVGTVVAVVGALAGSLGVVVSTASVSQVVAYVVAVLGASLVTRSAVTPVK